MLRRIVSLGVLSLVAALGIAGGPAGVASAQSKAAQPVVRTTVGCEGTVSVRTLTLDNGRSTRAVTYRIRNSRPSGKTIRTAVEVPAGATRVRRVRVRHQGWVADIGVRAAGRVLLDTVLVGRCAK